MNSFETYRAFITSLPARDRYEQTDLLVPDLLIEEGDGLRMFYAPFDSVNNSAKVIILGITPGWTQMELAFRTARTALAEGKSPAEVSRLAKLHASFAGSMRTNLIRMLDALGLPSRLEIGSSSDLFDGARHLLHTASAIRYPVFCGARNYSGATPPLARSPFLVGVARKLLVAELEAVPRAAIVPLGRSVEELLAKLAAEGRIRSGRWISGFPHPSGANGHRARQFAERREAMTEQLRDILNEARDDA